MKGIFLSAPGLVCCAGRDRDELYESCLKASRSGMAFRELPMPGGGKFPTGRIPWALPTVSPTALPTEIPADSARIISIIDAALEQIRGDVEEALGVYGSERIGVCLGSCDNGSEASSFAHRAFFADGSFPEGYKLRFQSASYPAEFIARKFGLGGPVFAIATACASGASAIVRGAELIRAGLCDAVIAGGADIVSDTVFLGFHALEALSDSFTNPFSKNRKGINLGEGAAFFLLGSSGPVALLGAGESSDAFHITAPGPDGAGPVKAMKAALVDAGISPAQISYVNLHGTGTELNDKAEALAMREVFGEAPPAAGSTKPVTGHTLGAAGALEAAICWMALTAKKGLPPHCWDGQGDEQLPFLPAVPDSGAPSIPSICMSNNFAFGGCNVSLVLGKRND